MANKPCNSSLMKRGDFGYSPAHGRKPVFATRLEA